MATYRSMTYRGYTGTVEQDESGVWYGSIVGIDGLYSYEADSISELCSEFSKSVEEYLSDRIKARYYHDKEWLELFPARETTNHNQDTCKQSYPNGNEMELEDCPFCGAQPEVCDGIGTQFEINCPDCGQAGASTQIADLMPIERFEIDTDQWAVVPRVPTVTNEMKAKFIGEFEWKEDASYYNDDERCHVEYRATRTVPWDLCKTIFKQMAAHWIAAAPRPEPVGV